MSFNNLFIQIYVILILIYISILLLFYSKIHSLNYKCSTGACSVPLLVLRCKYKYKCL